MNGVEQAHSTHSAEKNTGNFVGLNLETVAEITLQRTDTTHDLSSESREAMLFINTHCKPTLRLTCLDTGKISQCKHIYYIATIALTLGSNLSCFLELSKFHFAFLLPSL